MKKRTNIHLHNLSVSLVSKVFLIEKYEEKGLSSYEMDSLFYNLIQTKRLCDLMEKQDYTYKMGLLEKYVSYRYRVGSHNPKFRK